MALQWVLWRYCVLDELMYDDLRLANWADALGHDWYEKLA